MNKINIQAKRSVNNELIDLVCVRVTETLFICEDSNGNEYRFRRTDGAIAGSTSKRSITYLLTTESLSRLP